MLFRSGGVVHLEQLVNRHDLGHIPELGQGLGFPDEAFPGGGIIALHGLGIDIDKSALGAVTVDRVVGEEFLDTHQHIQIALQAQVGDAETTLSQNPAHNVLIRKNRAYGQLMPFIILLRRPAAMGADIGFDLLHAAVA